MLRLLLILSLCLSACCAPQAADVGLETAFRATVTGVRGAVLETDSAGQTLLLHLPPGHAEVAVGSSVYVRGVLTDNGVQVSSLQRLE